MAASIRDPREKFVGKLARSLGVETTMLLTPLWAPMHIKNNVQAKYARFAGRFAVCACGRRSGKTAIAKRRLYARATCPYMAGLNYVFSAPVENQAKRLFWGDMLHSPSGAGWLQPDQVEDRSESELWVRLTNGTTIRVAGMDKPERIEGVPLDGIVLDEYANMKERVWPEHVRPALMTLGRKPGWADFIGVPEGRNHFFRLAQEAKADITGEWSFFTWKSADILPAEDIDRERNSLDPRTFRQEWEASFETYAGSVYYTFERDKHVVPGLRAQFYDPRMPLVLCFDFNIKPGVAVVLQEVPASQVLERYRQVNTATDTVSCVIGEVWIPEGSRTSKVCTEIANAWGNHLGPIVCDGDPTGGAQRSSSNDGSDWDQIKAQLGAKFGARLSIQHKRHAPDPRARINAMCTRLQTTTGVIRMLFDAKHAVHTANDVEATPLKKDGSGDIDKMFDPMLSHASDGIGYWVERRFPIITGGFSHGPLTGSRA